ncbi:FANCI solenoid 2 domain [Trinorchestia longiramus]|nr:FANCI solenoid 2 domain [Trinorchestia longiramus]
MQVVSSQLREPNGVALAAGLLQALQGTTRESLAYRVKLYESVFEVVRVESSRGGTALNSNVLVGLMGVLLQQLEQFPSHCLVPFVEQYLELARIGEPLHGRWMDLLPKLVCTLAERDDIILDGGRVVSGQDYKYQVLRTFCEQEWPAPTASSLLITFKEMSLEKQELMDVVQKVERVLRCLEYQSVPPVIYQLVLLTQTRLPGTALKTAMAYFEAQQTKMENQRNESEATATSMDDISSAEMTDQLPRVEKACRDLREAQSTVILHVTHLAQFDPSIARDFIKLLRTARWLPHVLCSAFTLSLALSLAAVDRYQEQVVEAVRNTVLHSMVLARYSRRSAWLRGAWPQRVDMMGAVRQIITHCAQEVSSGVCVVLLSLLEGGAGVRSDAAALAVSCLPQLVSCHSHAAQHCLKHIATASLTAPHPRHYLSALGRLSRASPMVLLEHQSLLRELLLEQLQHHQPSTAHSILHALSNTFRMDVPLRDAAMLTLRKMLFSKDVQCRVLAVQGLVLLLQRLRVESALPSSQLSFSFSSALSQMSSSSTQVRASDMGRNESICHELLALLRRCFSLQHQVRTALYKGLYRVCRTNSKLCANILALLHQHLQSFVDLRSDCLNPIRYDDIVATQGDSKILQEPLGELLASIAASKVSYEALRHDPENENGLLEAEEHGSSDTILSDLSSMFDVLEQKLSICQVDDLEFDSTTEFSCSPQGQRNRHLAHVMVSVYDALIEHAFTCDPSRPPQKMSLCVSLFKKQKKIIELVKVKSLKASALKKGDGAAKSKGRPASKTEVFETTLRFSVVTEMLSVCLTEGDEDNDRCSKVFQESHDLRFHLLTCVESHLRAHKNLSPHEREHQLPYLRRLTRMLFVHCSELCSRVDASDEREVSELRLCITILQALFDSFIKYHSDKLEQILKEVTNKSAGKDIDTLAYVAFKGCHRMLMHLLNKEENDNLLRDAATIVHLMRQVSSIIDHDSEEIQKTFDWVQKLAKETSISNVPLCEEILKLLFSLGDQLKPQHHLDQQVARDVYRCLGDNDGNVSSEEAELQLKIINEGTATSTITVLMEHVDDHLGIVELSLNKMKAHLITATDYSADTVEKSVNAKLGAIIKTMYEIVKSALPLGTVIDLVIKKAEKIYSILALFTRYYLDVFRVKNFPQISEKFENLVHISGEYLSEPLYLFLNYVEDARSNGRRIALHTALKESKLIPALIFAIEKYEKLIIQLSKRSKVNLMTGMKLSTLRDFKIEPTKLQRLSDAQEQDDEAVDGSSSQNKADVSKKRKTSSDQGGTSQKKRKAKDDE